MNAVRTCLPALLVLAGATLAAQSPQERIQAGFKSLGIGSWESALREWSREGLWTDGDGKLQARLESLVGGSRSIGGWSPANPPYVATQWQRHWMVASFDQGAVYFLFDFVHHKGQWRLVALQATADPRDVLPHLDLLPALQALRKGE